MTAPFCVRNIKVRCMRRVIGNCFHPPSRLRCDVSLYSIPFKFKKIQRQSGNSTGAIVLVFDASRVGGFWRSICKFRQTKNVEFHPHRALRLIILFAHTQNFHREKSVEQNISQRRNNTVGVHNPDMDHDQATACVHGLMQVFQSRAC